MTAHVYTFRAEDDSVLYVGCTERFGYRIGQHITKPWWPQVARIESDAFPTLAEALLIEAARIREFQPLHNIIMMTTPDGTRKPVKRAIDPLLLKPAEAAAHLRVNVRTVYRLINDGQLPKVHIGEARATRIRRADLDAYIKKSAA